MKRNRTLAAAITSLCANAIYFGVIIFIFGLAVSGDIGGFVSAIAIITMVVSLAGIVFNSIAITAWNKDAEGYRRKKWCIVLTAILNLVLAFCILFGIAYNIGVTFANTLITYILFAALFVAAILYLVDASQEKKTDAAQPVAAKSAAVQAQPAPAAAQPAPTAAKTTAISAEEFATKVARIEALKKQGLISDEDYQIAKKTYIKEYLGK